MLSVPCREDVSRPVQCSAHRRSAVSHGVEPNWKLDCLFNEASRSIRNLLRSLLDTRRGIRDLADGNQLAPGKATAEGGTHPARRAVSTIPDDADVIVITNALGLGTLDDQ